MDCKTKLCIILSYSLSHKGYTCLHRLLGNIYVSRNVIFDETLFPFHESQPKPTNSSNNYLAFLFLCRYQLWTLLPCLAPHMISLCPHLLPHCPLHQLQQQKHHLPHQYRKSTPPTSITVPPAHLMRTQLKKQNLLPKQHTKGIVPYLARVLVATSTSPPLEPTCLTATNKDLD